MYKLIEPFDNNKTYNYDLKTSINKIYKDLKYLNCKDIKITIKDIKTGNDIVFIL